MFLLGLLPFLAATHAQSTASTFDIELVEANFEAAQLVPELISTFTPEGVLNVTFGGTDISIGQNLTQDAVGSSPTLLVVPSSNATDVSTSNNYTVMMVDADIVGTDEGATGQTRHWLVNNAKLVQGDSGYSVGYDGAISITDYAGPGPAAGSGAHRYVILVYTQPSTFTPPANLSTAHTPLSTFSFSDYVSQTGLGNLVAGNYFLVENGVATVSVPSTTPVNTATLATASTTSGSSSPSGTSSAPSGSKTSSASSSPSSSPSGAAIKQTIGMGAISGAVGIVLAVVAAGLGL
ncbi:hypothetical protein M231_05449 [Tremella mesenterica]|uniref:Nuclear protein n=2 Tax=Tremella mesenterica TaxID=5217 RepID=A0A4V1M3L7_TREME|nr:hypothetical protein M231_05449 [Tremella mesenterica]